MTHFPIEKKLPKKTGGESAPSTLVRYPLFRPQPLEDRVPNPKKNQSVTGGRKEHWWSGGTGSPPPLTRGGSKLRHKKMVLYLGGGLIRSKAALTDGGNWGAGLRGGTLQVGLARLPPPTQRRGGRGTECLKATNEDKLTVRLTRRMQMRGG